MTKRGTKREGLRRVRQEIRNCRHIENHNSCEWRQASGIPGAYRDRYLDRVTINTDPWKVALGIIRGPRGEVTYTYLYSPFPPPLPRSFVFFPAKRYSESNYFRYSRDTGARYCLYVIIAKRSFVLHPREDLCSHRYRLKILHGRTIFEYQNLNYLIIQ